MPRPTKLKTTNSTFTFNAIGRVSSPYKEKFAIPRQPGVVTAAKGKITLLASANNTELVRGLEQFSHIWLIFIFHATQEQGWKPLIRPPRLGGNSKMGVLASRSTFRPNPIGMSVVKLDGIEEVDREVCIHISGLDLLDNTPVLDIKPYIPYSDAIQAANAGYAQEKPAQALNISFSRQAQDLIINFHSEQPELKTLIEQVLAQDPRPAYKQKKQDNKVYGMQLFDFNIQWRMLSLAHAEVIDIRYID